MMIFFNVANRLTGGYNRGECLASMEIYEPCQGQWLDMPDMLTARARFGAALLNTFLYTIGGCDGITDLDSVHRFDFSCKTWDVVASLQTARSSVGESVASVNGATLNRHLICLPVIFVFLYWDWLF